MKTIEALIKGDRTELANLFGVGFIVSTKDTPESIIKKCEEYKERYASKIANLDEVLNNQDKLEDAIKKAKAKALIKSFDEEQQKALLEYLKEKYNN